MNDTLVKIQHLTHVQNTIHILAYVTSLCNYTCNYCSFSQYKNNSSLDLEILANFIITLYNKTKNNIYLELIGGEPTILSQLRIFIDKLHSYYPYITIGIYTNFSMNGDLYKFLVQHNVELTLTWHSIDVDKKNIKFINNYRYLYNQFSNMNIDVHVMYEKNNIENSLYAYQQLSNIDDKNTELCVLDYDLANNKIFFLKDAYYTSDEINIYDNIIKSKKKYESKYLYLATFKDGHTTKLRVQDIYRDDVYLNYCRWLCDAGEKYLYIDTKGNIYPCQAYFHNHEHCLGNIINFDQINFKKTLCKYDRCPCVWEATKTKIF